MSLLDVRPVAGGAHESGANVIEVTKSCNTVGLLCYVTRHNNVQTGVEEPWLKGASKLSRFG